MKPHGALNNMACEDIELATTLAKSINEISKDLIYLVPTGSKMEETAKKLNMSMDKLIVTIDEQGNTSAASIPLALDFGIKQKKIKPGHLILMEAFGGGFTWGSALIRI